MSQAKPLRYDAFIAQAARHNAHGVKLRQAKVHRPLVNLHSVVR
jgi:hypothetical protein